MQLSRKQFFDFYRKAFGPLQQLQVDGLEFLLGKIEADKEWDSLPQVAYFLATIKHETGVSRNRTDQTFQPIKELRERPGTARRRNQDRYWLSGYYGRGYIQLTWKDNYAKFGLADVPDDALQPDTAYMVAARGMREGKFTKFKLADFINDQEVDYFGARRVVNGLDKAEKIADEAEKFERILKSSLATETVKEQKDRAEAELQKKDLEKPSASVEPKKEDLPTTPPAAPQPSVSVSHPPTAQPKDDGTVTVQKVVQSLGSKVLAGGALVGSIGSALLGAFLGIINNPYALAIIIVGGTFIAVYAWNKSKDRQLMIQTELINKGASRDHHTVVLETPPPKTEGG